MKYLLSALSAALSISVAIASPALNILEHADKIKNAVIEKRVAGQPFVDAQLEKRASSYLNDQSKSAYDKKLSMIMPLTDV